MATQHVHRGPTGLGKAKPSDAPGPTITSEGDDDAVESPNALVLGLPQDFDGYRVLRVLGRGGMGVVFLGEDALLGRHVAIKVLLQRDETSLGRERFAREARVLARLSHPNLLGVHRAGEVNGIRYIVSELVRGTSLDELPLPLTHADLLRIATAVAAGLAAAHRRGVLHRDLKPSNVMLSDEGEVKICDFGIARLLDDGETTAAGGHGAGSDDSSDLTLGGGWVGTPRYLAPEIWRGERATPATDIFAFGALVYRLASGQDAIPGDGMQSVRNRALELGATPLHLVAPDVERRLCALVDASLHLDPARRPASADELHAELRLIGTPAGALPDGNPYRGLRPFEPEHRALFFGRRRETLAVVERLGSENLVVVTGDSGVGKSSLVRAGVLPLVADGALAGRRSWSTAVVRPGRRPVDALAHALAPWLGAPDEIIGELRQEPRRLARRLAGQLGGERGLVLLVDQLEELVADSEEHERAAAALVLAELSVGMPGVRVLATARADFLSPLSALPGLGPLLDRAVHLLGPLDAAQLGDAIAGPARALGYRFESQAMIDELVASVGGTAHGLPLLQFALTELWERRDGEQRLLRAAALAALGGVESALLRHADALLGSLSPEARQAARELLTRMVTAQGTRAERSEPDLVAGRPAAAAALRALVDGRLLAVRGDEHGQPRYELAHEALIVRWTTLRAQLEADRERLVALERVEQAAAEWRRLGHARAALWSPLQLDEAARAGVDAAALADEPRGFLVESQRLARRRRWRNRALVAAAPLAVLALWQGADYKQDRDRAAAVSAQLAAARPALASIGHQVNETRASWQAAMDEFDHDRTDAGEARLRAARSAYSAAAEAYVLAIRPLETALQIDRSRQDARRLLADVLYQRALLAELVGDAPRVHESLERLAVVDGPDGRLAEWTAPATVAVASEPAGAKVSVAAYDTSDVQYVLGPARAVGVTPVDVELAPGSYLMTLEVAGRPQVRYPVMVSRGEKLAVEVPVPAEVPEGYVYVAPGRFYFGSDLPDPVRRGDYDAEPLHQVQLDGYLIGRHEVTWSEWIAFLESLPAGERAALLPHAAGLQLSRAANGTYELTLKPSQIEYRVAQGQPLVYAAREKNRQQDWSRMPVTGVNIGEARRYAAWMAETGRLPGARLCSQQEWERASRGADQRTYPTGAELRADQANVDLTYERNPGGFGPDEVGLHPASDSPFGVADLAGNVFEFVADGGPHGAPSKRGGSFYQQTRNATTFNRAAIEPAFRSGSVGLRLCASSAQD